MGSRARRMGNVGARRLVGVLAAVVAAVPLTLVSLAPAYAATTTRYVATTGDDTTNDCTDPSNPCLTIQYAVDQANAGDTVSIGAGSYDQSVSVRKSMTITGAGASLTKMNGDPVSGDTSLDIDGTDTDTAPEVIVSDLALSDNAYTSGMQITLATVTLTDSEVDGNDGDGVDVGDGGTLDAADSEFSGNDDNGVSATPGIDSPQPGSVHLTSCTASSNQESGLDIESGDSAVVTGCDISHNQHDGLYLSDASTSVTVDRSTLDGNFGIGIEVDPGSSATVTRSTISHTSPSSGSDQDGGGVLDFNGASLTMSESTVAGNTNFGVADLGTGVFQIQNSTITGTADSDPPSTSTATGPDPAASAALLGGLVMTGVVPATATPAADPAGQSISGTLDAGNDVPDCSGSFTDSGYNLESDGSCHWLATGSVFAPDPQLGGLSDNGGPTSTVLPGYSSAARNAIPLGKAGCAAGATDQRGKPRPDAVLHRCDIGSVEAQVVNPKITAHVTAAHHQRHGWYRGSVSVRFTCTIGSAPLTSGCPASLRTRKSGHHRVTKTVHALDRGKVTLSRSFKIDNTKPRIRLVVRHGKLHARCHDSFSGVGTCHLTRHRHGSTLTYRLTARDKAGNVSHKKGKVAI